MLADFIDFLFPPTCILCKRPLLTEEKVEFVCYPCLARNSFFEPNEGCKLPHIPSCNLATVLGNYRGSLKECVHSFKYKRQKNLARPLAIMMIRRIMLLEWNEPDAVVFVPLHPERQRERGYNQSALLAKEMYKFIGVPVLDLLERKNNTPPQAKLVREDRLNNIKGAFGLKGEIPSGVSEILLVDDVITTGATMEEAASVLASQGVETICGVAIAH